MIRLPLPSAPVLRFFLPLAGLGLNGLLVWKLHRMEYLPLLQNPAFHPISLFFAGLLVVLALLLPWVMRPSGSPLGIRADLARFAILLAPVAAFFLLPDATQCAKILADRAWLLQTFSNQRPYLGRQHLETVHYVQNLLPQLPPGEPVDLDLDAVVSLASQADSRALFTRVPFRTRAQYLPSTEEGQPWKMARLIMICCVADSRPLILEAEGRVPTLEENAWVEATGTLDVQNGRPFFKVSEVKAIEPEDELFLYGP